MTLKDFMSADDDFSLEVIQAEDIAAAELPEGEWCRLKTPRMCANYHDVAACAGCYFSNIREE